MQHINSGFPILLINQIVEIRNDVIHWAAAGAKRNAAIHATRTLLLGLIIAQMQYKFFVVFNALNHRQVCLGQLVVFHKTRYFAHTKTFILLCFYAACFAVAAANSVNARLYSIGMTLTNLLLEVAQSANKAWARTLPV